ncbi:MAG: magnesium/cobalt transporter CorA [Chloroflexota bacterium]|nr:magnesium/cobalt transporter CorA [Chloroflexota bacterium]
MHVRTFDQTGFHDIEKPNWNTLITLTDAVLWVDMTGHDPEEVRILLEVFKFHPLAIEDSTNKYQRPKIESYPDHAFAIMNTVRLTDGDIVFSELDVFVTKNAVVTIHGDNEPLIEEVARRCQLRSSYGLSITVGYLVYVLMDTSVDAYFPILDEIGEEIDTFSEEILAHPKQSQLERIFHLKRDINELWRIAGYQRDMFSVLGREEQHFIQDDSLRYFLRDVYDHMLRVNDTVNALRDTLSNVLDLYVTSQSNRLNIVVWRLTIVTTIIGSMTVIGGFYGMNFERTFPPFDSPWGVPFTLVLMVVTGVVLFRILNRRA